MLFLRLVEYMPRQFWQYFTLGNTLIRYFMLFFLLICQPSVLVCPVNNLFPVNPPVLKRCSIGIEFTNIQSKSVLLFSLLMRYNLLMRVHVFWCFSSSGIRFRYHTESEKSCGSLQQRRKFDIRWKLHCGCWASWQVRSTTSASALNISSLVPANGRKAMDLVKQMEKNVVRSPL